MVPSVTPSYVTGTSKKAEIRDGGPQRVSMYYSVSFIWKEIPAAIPMFSGSRNMAKLKRYLSDVKMNDKSEMLAPNQQLCSKEDGT